MVLYEYNMKISAFRGKFNKFRDSPSDGQDYSFRVLIMKIHTALLLNGGLTPFSLFIPIHAWYISMTLCIIGCFNVLNPTLRWSGFLNLSPTVTSWPSTPPSCICIASTCFIHSLAFTGMPSHRPPSSWQPRWRSSPGSWNMSSKWPITASSVTSRRLTHSLRSVAWADLLESRRRDPSPWWLWCRWCDGLPLQGAGGGGGGGW